MFTTLTCPDVCRAAGFMAAIDVTGIPGYPELTEGGPDVSGTLEANGSL
jgi:hypothetical protein